MRVLVMGGSGFLGRELIRQALVAGDRVDATYLSHPVSQDEVGWHQVDLRDRAAVNDLLCKQPPGVVINAAYQQAEWVTTANGAAHVALACAVADVRLVHVSSDAVFAGSPQPYDEMSTPDPITAYGAAKAAAETAVAAIAPTAVIVRTSLILGDGDSVHERLVHQLAAEPDRGALFSDDIRCPVHVADLASALLELAATTRSGIHHIGGAEAVSRYELGRMIARRDGLDPDVLRSGRRADSDVSGPLEVRLDSTRTQAHLRTELRGASRFLAVREDR